MNEKFFTSNDRSGNELNMIQTVRWLMDECEREKESDQFILGMLEKFVLDVRPGLLGEGYTNDG